MPISANIALRLHVNITDELYWKGVENKFVAFEGETINREFRGLPHRDRRDLTHAMESFQDFGYESAKALCEEIQDGVLRIKNKNGTAGRGLYFGPGKRRKGRNILVLLTVYKKESQKTDKTALRRAISRKRRTEV